MLRTTIGACVAVFCVWIVPTYVAEDRCFDASCPAQIKDGLAPHKQSDDQAAFLQTKFQTLQASKVSSVTCRDVAGVNQSCRIRNAYVEPKTGNIWLMLREGTAVPHMRRLDGSGVPGQGLRDIMLKYFASDDELAAHVASLAASRVDGLAVMARFIWGNAWAHVMFDGLWPAYLALAKFQKHLEPFHVLEQDLDLITHNGSVGGLDCSLPEHESLSMPCSLRQTIGRFAQNNKTQHTRWISLQETPSWLVVDDLVFGSQGGGEYTTVGGLPGSAGSLEWLPSLPSGTDLLTLFANRMFRTQGIPELESKTSSSEGIGDRKLRVIITEDKRYTPEEITSFRSHAGMASGDEQLATLQEDAQSASLTAAHILNQRRDVEAYYVNWADYFPFMRQLHVIRKADIHVTSTGTAQFFTVFLPYGAVNVNLGYFAPHPVKTARSVPTWGEEFLASSNPRIRAIYRNVSSLRKGSVTTKELLDLVDVAIKKIRNGFPIPLAKLDENLSPIGKVAYRLVSSDAASLHGARGYMTGSALDCHMKTGFAQMDAVPIVCGFLDQDKCPINKDLLNSIKSEMLGSEFSSFFDAVDDT